MIKRGLLILFEGLDRSGKSTQVQLLHEALTAMKIPSEVWRYPNRKTEIGKLINSYLNKDIEMNDHSVHLLFSANRWETIDTMHEKINNGITLIVDRYAYSGVAYTSAKSGFDFEWCKQCDKGLPKPDLICFMDTKLLEMDNRESFGKERYEVVEFQRVVYKNFEKLLNLSKPDEDCLILNAKDSIENIHSKVIKFVEEKFKQNLSQLDLLW